jgi:flagellar assembly protein FliH
LTQAGSATSNGYSGRIEIFEYPAGPDAPLLATWDEWAGVDGSAPTPAEIAVADAGGSVHEAGLHAEFDRQLAEEARRALEAGREKGQQEGRAAEREAQAAALAATEKQRALQAAQLIENFAQERDRYLHDVEHEVVELALAVAARILRREAQMDPLLLTGAVRVALGQLSASTEVRLRVPAAELDLWTEAIALLPKLAVKPAVLAGEEMRLGDCMIETELGSVDLGIRAQLGEIERGFFDRAAGGRSPAAQRIASGGESDT